MSNARDRVVLKQGMLKKRAVSENILNKMKPWRTRRIVLRRDVIEWYKAGQAEGMQGSLIIDTGSTVHPKGSRAHSFSVNTDGVTLLLQATNDEERNEWFDAVQRVQQERVQDEADSDKSAPEGGGRPSFVANAESTDEEGGDEEGDDDGGGGGSGDDSDGDWGGLHPIQALSAEERSKKLTSGDLYSGEPLFTEAPQMDGGVQGLSSADGLEEDDDGDLAHGFIERMSGLQRDSLPGNAAAAAAAARESRSPLKSVPQGKQLDGD